MLGARPIGVVPIGTIGTRSTGTGVEVPPRPAGQHVGWFEFDAKATTVDGVAISPSSITLVDGQGQAFSGTVTGTGAFDPEVLWTATAGNIDASGNLTLPSVPLGRTVIVTATSVQNPSKTATAVVTQLPATVTPAPTVTGVAVSPATSVLAGDNTRQFSAVVTGANAPSQGVTWSTTLGQISESGVLTAPAATSSLQSGVVTATSTLDPTKSGVATFTVVALIVVTPPAGSVVTGVVVTPETATGEQIFSAVVSGTNSPSQMVNWSATAGSITTAGEFTPPDSTYQVQVVSITATSAQDPTMSDTSTVTIAALPTPHVYSVLVSPNKPYVAGGGSQLFTARVDGSNQPPQSVTWATTFGTITSGGVLTVPVTGVPRKAVVTATSSFDPTKSATASVTVTPPVLYGVAGPRSKARTYVVTDPQVVPDTSDGTGAFWNFSNPAKPKGVKDPDAVIDVSFDWTKWFADSGDGYASHVILVNNGVVLTATNQENKIVTAFVAAGDGGPLAEVTCRIKSNSIPPREDDRTVYLRITER